VILDLKEFIVEQQEVWREFEALLDAVERNPTTTMDIEKVKRFHHLYQLTSADLARLQSFASEPELKQYLESLIGRAFGEIYESRRKPHRIAPLTWFFRSFPRAFHRRIGAFRVALAAMLLGCLFGGAALVIDPGAKETLLPFAHLRGDPSDRVAKEEQGPNKALESYKAVFSSQLVTHNVRVAVSCMAMGITFGIGTLILLFYNGVILGAVALDYIRAGESAFLFGWLLPHGSVEIPAIILAGQAGLVLAQALLGRRHGVPLSGRLRSISRDLTTLIGGVAILLVWAGIIEAFFSQYHEPMLPYSLKISFGAVELVVLALFLGRCGNPRLVSQDTERA